MCIVKNSRVPKKSWCDFADWFAPYSNTNPDLYMEQICNIIGEK